MFKKNIKPILMAGALALATAVSPVFAEQNNATPNSIPVYKELVVAEGNNNVSETFNFTVQIDKYYAYAGDTGATPTTYPTYTLNSITANTKYPASWTYKGSSSISFSLNGAVPGVYTYNLVENEKTPTTNQTYKTDKTTYKLYVTVENVRTESGDAITESVQITSVKATKTGGTDKDGNNVSSSNDKLDNITFVNEMIEDKVADSVFSLRKVVDGKTGDKTKLFRFSGTITLPANTIGTSYTLTGGRNSEGVETDITLNSGVNENVVFYLRNGDTISSGKLPVGTTYSITEDSVNGYTTTVVGDDDNVTEERVADGRITDEPTDLDQITVTNTNNSTPVTGVIVNNMPYIALLGASGAGLVVLAASKKRSKK